MKRKQYRAALNRADDKLANIDLIAGNYKLLTLGCSTRISADVFQQEVKKFLINFAYAYGQFEYISRKECYKDWSDRFHCHIIVIFDSQAPVLSRKWLEEH